MALTIPATATRQPNDVDQLDDANNLRYSIRFKGPYDDLKTATRSFVQGDEYDGRILKNWTLERAPGDQGFLTLGLGPSDATGEHSAQEPLKVTWSVHAVRNDQSILAYCGPSEGNNANRPHIEMWMKETDPDAIAADEYVTPDGRRIPLTDMDLLVVGKLKKGIESVIRFYPLFTRKRIYAADPTDSLQGLGFIDTLPDGAPSISGDYEWLKVQDDKDQQSDGNYIRIESWMGALSSEGGWDEDLYGSDRWSMPLERSTGD